MFKVEQFKVKEPEIYCAVRKTMHLNAEPLVLNPEL